MTDWTVVSVGERDTEQEREDWGGEGVDELNGPSHLTSALTLLSGQGYNLNVI